MSLKDKIKAAAATAMGLQVANNPSPGVQVLKPGEGNLFVTEEQDGGGRVVLRVAHTGGQAALVLEPDGQNSTVTYYQHGSSMPPSYGKDDSPAPGRPEPGDRRHEKLVYTPGSETLSTQLYAQLKRSIVSAERSPASWPRRAAVAAFWLLAGASAILLLGSGGTSARPQAAAPAIAPAPAAAAAGAERIPAEARASEQERAAVAALQGVIRMGAPGKPFYVFTDPNCPYCRDFERTLQSVPPGFQPVIVPLGYKPGSAATSAAVLCSANPASEWRQAMLSQPSPSLKSCDNGERQVRENMAVFESMRLNRTPTILTPGDFLVSGAANAPELAMILGAAQQ